jgi:putative acetyltransferase
MPHQLFTIRKALLSDLAALQILFVNSIEVSCKKEYNAEQIRVWCASIHPTARWEKCLHEDFFLVAEQSGQLIGFASLHKLSYLDFLYVHPQFQRRGVAGSFINYWKKRLSEIKCQFCKRKLVSQRKDFLKKRDLASRQNRKLLLMAFPLSIIK